MATIEMSVRAFERRLFRVYRHSLVALLAIGPGVASGGMVDHGPWDTILKQYVDGSGHIAYRRLQAESADALETYLKTVAAARVDGLPQKDQLAFWINAYNATIVAGVLQGRSPETKVTRFRLFRVYERVIAGQQNTPDEIESVVRGFHDARAHFALVCASTSCPKLRHEAYVGVQLDAQLDDQARRFVNDPSRNRIDPIAGVVGLSMIFTWFNDEFTRGGHTLADFLVPYVTAAQVKLLREKAPQYLEYDWTMNAQAGQRP
jgi:hypothetical protein